MHLVKKADYLKDYKVLLTFEDKKTKLVDLENHLEGEIFEPLKEISFFRSFKLSEEIDTIVWENGADISPDFLYKIGKDI